jgi:hypothetical protein
MLYERFKTRGLVHRGSESLSLSRQRRPLQAALLPSSLQCPHLAALLPPLLLLQLLLVGPPPMLRLKFSFRKPRAPILIENFPLAQMSPYPAHLLATTSASRCKPPNRRAATPSTASSRSTYRVLWTIQLC